MDPIASSQLLLRLAVTVLIVLGLAAVGWGAETRPGFGRDAGDPSGWRS